MEDARMLAAIAAVRRAIAEQAVVHHGEDARRIHAMGTVAATVRASIEQDRARLLARIEARLLPVDPLRQTWNVFRLFDVEYAETRWTQWMAGVLRAENGARCARLAWSALCDAIARRADQQAPTGSDRLLDADGWRAAAREAPEIEDEVPDGDLGRLDLLATTSTLVAAIENKLWADWHDGSGLSQAERYRQLAMKRLGAGPDRRLGLVLLSQREGLKVGDGYPPDYVHVSWRDVGQALRRALPAGWSTDAATTIELMPVVLTLVSIEQDLLGLALGAGSQAGGNPFHALKDLAALAEYLDDR